MIDIHSHIIPGVDDGAESTDEALAMLGIAASGGVSTIVATPHFDPGSGYENVVSSSLEERFLRLEYSAGAEGIPVKLVKGMEIFAGEDVPYMLEDGLLWTLGGTDYILTEFAFTEDPAYCREYLRRCARRGFKPVIAHPERYVFIQHHPQIAYEWCREGYGLQLNRGSLLGRFGEQAEITALRLVKHGLAACIASDAHGADRRSTYLKDVKEFLDSEMGEEYSDLLLNRNPARILAGKELLGFEPYPFI